MARRGRPKSDALAVVAKPPKLSREEIVRLPKSLKELVRVKKMMADPLHDFIARTAGGKETVYWLLKRSTHDGIAVKVVEAWDRLIRAAIPALEVKRVDIDQLLEITELDARDFVSCIVRCAWDVNIGLGQAIFALRYPEMMHASMQRATQVSGTEERRMHFQATGHLPQKAGIQIGIKNVNNAAAEDQSPGHAPSFRQTARAVVRDLPPARDE